MTWWQSEIDEVRRNTASSAKETKDLKKKLDQIIQNQQRLMELFNVMAQDVEKLKEEITPKTMDKKKGFGLYGDKLDGGKG